MDAVGDWASQRGVIKDRLRSIIKLSVKRHDDMYFAHAPWVGRHDFGHFSRCSCEIDIHVTGFDTDNGQHTTGQTGR